MRYSKRRKGHGRIRQTMFKGHITVMLSLLLSVVLLFLLTCSEGVHIYLGKGRAGRNLISAQESVMADYNRFLWEKYHIFAVDETYGTGNSEAIQLKLQEYFLDSEKNFHNAIKTKFYAYTLEQIVCRDKIYLTDDVEVLKNQIKEYMKYQIGKDAIKDVIQKLQLQLDESAIAAAREKVEESETKAKEVEEEENKETGKEENQSGVQPDNKTDSKADDKTKTEGKQKPNANPVQTDHVEDPRDTLQNLLKMGLVELVTGRNDISRESYPTSEVKVQGGALNHSDSSGKQSDTSEESRLDEKKFPFEEAKEVTERLQWNNGLTSLSNQAVTEALAVEYAVRHFSTVLQPEQGGIQCQCEYLIGGKHSDYENVKSVIQRIIALRFPVNFVCIMKDAAKIAEARSLSTAIVGASGNPAVVELVSYLLLACQCYGEAIVDVRRLLQGERVEFWKDSQNWKLSLHNFADIVAPDTNKGENAQLKEDGEGFSYEDYLKILLLLQSQPEQKYERMLHVMSVTGRQNQSSFSLSNMVFAFQTDAVIRLAPVFANVFLGADGEQGYLMEFQKVVSY